MQGQGSAPCRASAEKAVQEQARTARPIAAGCLTTHRPAPLSRSWPAQPHAIRGPVPRSTSEKDSTNPARSKPPHHGHDPRDGLPLLRCSLRARAPLCCPAPANSEAPASIGLLPGLPSGSPPVLAPVQQVRSRTGESRRRTKPVRLMNQVVSRGNRRQNFADLPESAKILAFRPIGLIGLIGRPRLI